MSPAPGAQPFTAPDPEKIVETLNTAAQAEGMLPADVLGSWTMFGQALGRALPQSINQAAAHRRALRRLVN